MPGNVADAIRCTATSGPGTVNLLNGLADAFFDKAPVLAITGQVDTNKIGYQLPITLIVFCNGTYNLEKYKMMGQGMSLFGCELPVPDYAGYAEAYGAKGFRVNNPEQLTIVLPEALNCQVPTIVEIDTADVPLGVSGKFN